MRSSSCQLLQHTISSPVMEEEHAFPVIPNTLTHTDELTCTRHTNIFIHTLSLTHTHTHTHMQFFPFTHTHIDTHTHTHTCSSFLSHTHTHTHTHTHSHTHTHTHTLSRYPHSNSSQTLSEQHTFTFLLSPPLPRGLPFISQSVRHTRCGILRPNWTGHHV